jgi:hypothetical protein
MAMKTMFILATALALAGCTQEVDSAKRGDAPFGLARGDLIPDIQIGSTPDANGYAVMREVPAPEAPFVNYAVIVRENIGVCQIMAASGNFARSNDEAARGRAAMARESIEKKYGPPHVVLNSCKGDSLCKPDVWAEGIARGARQYGFTWGSMDKPLNAYIKQIRLEVRTNEVMEPYVRADYIFTNEAACKAVTPAAKPKG